MTVSRLIPSKVPLFVYITRLQTLINAKSHYWVLACSYFVFAVVHWDYPNISISLFHALSAVQLYRSRASSSVCIWTPSSNDVQINICIAVRHYPEFFVPYYKRDWIGLRMKCWNCCQMCTYFVNMKLNCYLQMNGIVWLVFEMAADSFQHWTKWSTRTV